MFCRHACHFLFSLILHRPPWCEAAENPVGAFGAGEPIAQKIEITGKREG